MKIATFMATYQVGTKLFFATGPPAAGVAGLNCSDLRMLGMLVPLPPVFPTDSKCWLDPEFMKRSAGTRFQNVRISFPRLLRLAFFARSSAVLYAVYNVDTNIISSTLGSLSVRALYYFRLRRGL